MEYFTLRVKKIDGNLRSESSNGPFISSHKTWKHFRYIVYGLCTFNCWWNLWSSEIATVNSPLRDARNKFQFWKAIVGGKKPNERAWDMQMLHMLQSLIFLLKERFVLCLSLTGHKRKGLHNTSASLVTPVSFCSSYMCIKLMSRLVVSVCTKAFNLCAHLKQCNIRQKLCVHRTTVPVSTAMLLSDVL